MGKKHKQILGTFVGWAVTQKDYVVGPEDIFYRRKPAYQYKRDCFEPEHKAKVVKVTVEVRATK